MSCERPIAMPIAIPTDIASAKLAETRKRVTPR